MAVVVKKICDKNDRNRSDGDTSMKLGTMVLYGTLINSRGGAKAVASWYSANLHKSKMAAIDIVWDTKL